MVCPEHASRTEETMDIKGSYSFDAPVARVWEALLDPDMLARCMPGCEKLTPVGNDQFNATISLGVGAIKGTYQARITVADRVPMRSYKLIIEGEGSPGFVRGEALVSLDEEASKTLVKVDGEAQVGGTIARVGQRLIGSVNKMMMDRFFACLGEATATGTQGSPPET